MKKLILIALLGLFLISGISTSYAQEDTTQFVTDEPTDTISVDNMDPIFYEEEAPKETSNGITYAIIGGVLVIGAGAYFYMNKKKK
jgi:LPXTG-motif cell wall-anchored protein